MAWDLREGYPASLILRRYDGADGMAKSRELRFLPFFPLFVHQRLNVFAYPLLLAFQVSTGISGGGFRFTVLGVTSIEASMGLGSPSSLLISFAGTSYS